MSTLQEYYDYARLTMSDIFEHIEIINRYAGECAHVTEMSARGGVVTWALLYAKPRKVVSYDVADCREYALRDAAEENGIEYEFHIADTGNPTTVIEPTDLLFIDTWHTYAQLKQELALHSGKVKKYILVHDTLAFGNSDEWDGAMLKPANYECYVKPTENRGLWPAIVEFLQENKEWQLREKFANCNGLTVLERVGE